MATNTIDAGLLAKMFLAGAKNLEVKKEWINELNVFPVPDGDTGTNMTLTIMSAVKEVNSLTEVNMYNLSKAISSGSLRGARGNSGVILSQLLRGFTKKIRDYEELNAEILAEAMEKRVESGQDILYLLQDMQEFELYGTVRAVVSVCDSMNYVTEPEDLEYVFALVNNYLDPGGLFIFDMNTIHKYRDVIGDTTIAEDREDGSFIWENSYDRENALNVYELALFLPREDGLYEKCEEEHVQKAYSIEAIKAMIVKAGMELVAVYDAYTHNPGDENCERLTFVAREHGKSAQNGYHGRIPEKPETHRAD